MAKVAEGQCRMPDNLCGRGSSCIKEEERTTLAVVTISRDLQSLQAEAAMEARLHLPRREVA